MDALVLPSLFEGLPMVGVEAQCAGLPMVCSDRVPDEVAIGHCEFLPLEATPDRWATRVAQAIDLGRDLGRRGQGASLTRTAGFDITREAGRLAHQYRDLAGR